MTERTASVHERRFSMRSHHVSRCPKRQGGFDGEIGILELPAPPGGKGAPAGGTGGGKDGQHTEVGSRLHVTTTDSRTGQISLGDGGGHRLASWTSGYATARSEAICRGAGCGRTRTSGSVGGQGQQRPWSTRPRFAAGFTPGPRNTRLRLVASLCRGRTCTCWVPSGGFRHVGRTTWLPPPPGLTWRNHGRIVSYDTMMPRSASRSSTSRKLRQYR